MIVQQSHVTRRVDAKRKVAQGKSTVIFRRVFVTIALTSFLETLNSALETGYIVIRSFYWTQSGFHRLKEKKTTTNKQTNKQKRCSCEENIKSWFEKVPLNPVTLYIIRNVKIFSEYAWLQIHLIPITAPQTQTVGMNNDNFNTPQPIAMRIAMVNKSSILLLWFRLTFANI